MATIAQALRQIEELERAVSQLKHAEDEAAQFVAAVNVAAANVELMREIASRHSTIRIAPK